MLSLICRAYSVLGPMPPLLLGILLASCSNAPAPPLMTPLEVAESFGYSEKKTAPDTYEVSYLTPARSTSFEEKGREPDIEQSAALARDLALWRAAELALSQGYPAFHVVDTSKEVRVHERDRTYYPPYYAEPYSPFFPPLLVGPTRPVYPFGYTDFPIEHRAMMLQVRVDLRVVFEHAKGPGSEDSAEVAQRMRARYPQALATGQR